MTISIKPELAAEYDVHVAMNSQDDYSKGVIDYEQRWADMMQMAISEGATVAKAAEMTQFAADTGGITGFMFGCAVQGLSKFWAHGDDLRLWHNGKHGVGPDVEGVVNPAIISIGPAPQ